MKKQELNDFYSAMDLKSHELSNPFMNGRGSFHCEVGFSNGHFSKGEDGEYEMDLFPIPVVYLGHICQIEVSMDQIMLRTKLGKEEALCFDYEKIADREFEIYENDDPRSNIFRKGDAIESLKKKLLVSQENELNFAFLFPYTIDGVSMYGFVKFLRNEGFYM